MGVRYTIVNTVAMVDVVAVVIVEILVRRLGTGVTVGNDKILI